MHPRKTLITVSLCLLASVYTSTASSAARERVTLCSDKGYWFPFTLMKDYRAAGVFIDMMKEAAIRTDRRVLIRPASWSRCLRLAKEGKVDGILGASYKDERNEWMEYPPTARRGKGGEHSMSLVDYVIVTPKTLPFTYNGTPSTLPGPVRVPRSYSIADDLKKNQAKVKATYSTDRSALVDLVRMQDGSAAVLGSIAKEFQKNPFFSNKYDIQKKTLKSKNYYLTFSRKSDLPRETRETLWAALQVIREDEDLMGLFYEKYLNDEEI
ncbi:transporter substrate-binding domain-containing protein [Parendozoicomonas sp. Alg238-R29]|uniref:substrate-binding periplasmic protein n=1 Tax=Parendozoicomonas sp. Alg238-R29 TaxID=2993446 RepID=UPI00248F282E|nr:transporter substrate-binding domain-containing protein [Parendozoicomonas sp. Alg238-R29]